MATATVTSKGQVTIPKEIREQMNISAKDELSFVVLRDGKLIVRRKTHDIADLRGAWKKLTRART
jgi:antitoxin PrlF